MNKSILYNRYNQTRARQANDDATRELRDYVTFTTQPITVNWDPGSVRFTTNPAEAQPEAQPTTSNNIHIILRCPECNQTISRTIRNNQETHIACENCHSYTMIRISHEGEDNGRT